MFENAHYSGMLTFPKSNPLILPYQFIIRQYNNIENTQNVIGTDLSCILLDVC